MRSSREPVSAGVIASNRAVLFNTDRDIEAYDSALPDSRARRTTQIKRSSLSIDTALSDGAYALCVSSSRNAVVSEEQHEKIPPLVFLTGRSAGTLSFGVSLLFDSISVPTHTRTVIPPRA
jgi:hypothetical protein